MGGEDYTAPAILSPQALGDLIDKQDLLAAINTTGQKDTVTEMLGLLADIFDLVLEPESAQRVRERLYSREKPYDLAREVMPTVVSLVEEYTGRPFPQSPPSSTSSTAAGTGSTDGPPAAVSTPEPLALTGT